MTRLGYARAWLDADLAEQARRLRALDPDICIAISQTRASRGECDRFEAIIRALACGDELVIWRLPVLGRSTGEILDRIRRLMLRGIVLRVLDPDITTASNSFTLLAALEMVRNLENDLRREQRADLEAARKRQIPVGGRQKKVDEREIRRRVAAGASKASIARDLNISRMSVYRALTAGQPRARAG
ncbi:recombinase family protein [Sphingopyxis sp. LARHCG72]